MISLNFNLNSIKTNFHDIILKLPSNTDSIQVYLFYFILVVFALIIIIKLSSLTKLYYPMKFLLIIFSICLIPGASVAFIISIKTIFTIQSIWIPFIIGFVIGVVLYELVLSKISGLDTFEHEFTHAIVALLFLHKINKFTSTSNEGGYVSHSGGFGGKLADQFIGLAPYYLPTLTFFSAIIRPLLPKSAFPWFDLWIGITLAYHTLSTYKETIRNWHKRRFQCVNTNEYTLSDIGKRGYLFSGLMIISLTLSLHSLIFYLLTQDFRGFTSWSDIIYSNSSLVVKSVFFIIKSFFS